MQRMHIGLVATLLAVGAPTARAVDLTPTVMKDKPTETGTYAVSSLLAIGGADADEPAQFFEKLGTIAADASADGHVYVLDNGNARVQVFDAEGNHVRTIGQEGRGPGEFQLPNGFSVNAGGDVAVFDMGQQRLSLFDASGTLLRDEILEEGVNGILLHDDRAISVVYSTGRPAVLCTYDAKGDVAWMYQKAPEERPNDGRIMNFKIGGGSLLAKADDRMFLGADNTYAVVPLTLDGTPGDVFARAYERQAFEMRMPKKDDGEDGPRMIMIKKEVTTDMGAGGEPGGTKTEISFGDDHGDIDMDDLRSMMPEFSPDLQLATAWPDGRLWLVTSDSDDDTMRVDEWADGEYIRRFELPGTYDSMQVGNDGELYAVSHDEDDFPIVHHLSVSPNF